MTQRQSVSGLALCVDACCAMFTQIGAQAVGYYEPPLFLLSTTVQDLPVEFGESDCKGCNTGSFCLENTVAETG